MLSGKGAAVPKFTLPANAVFALVELTHSGTRNFIVRPVDATGSEGASLVNVIGKYSGSVLLDFDSAVAFQIDADGAWTATIKPIQSAPGWSPIVPLSGTGDNVYLVGLQGGGLTTIRLTHSGKRNFIVTVWTTNDRSLLVNKIGAYEGEVVLPQATVLLVVEADGAWTITRT